MKAKGLRNTSGLVLILFFLVCKQARSQYIPNFFGINPGITVEPYYEKGEFDVNIFPLVWQRPIFKQVDFRLNSILNLGIRNSGNVISHYGLELAFPCFFTRREKSTEDSQGFYLAVVSALTRNEPAHHSNLGMWLEPGYLFQFSKGFGLSLGLQWGATSFYYDQGEQSWGSHFGFKAIFGRWF